MRQLEIKMISLGSNYFVFWVGFLNIILQNNWEYLKLKEIG